MILMNKVFVDTSFLIALLNSQDADHTVALVLQAELASQPVDKLTSEYILLELGDGLSKLRYRNLAVQTVELLKQDSTFHIIPASNEIWKNAWSLFTSYQDKEWSLTDCTSFVLMRQFNLNSALTADKHFQQAGFRALLLEI